MRKRWYILFVARDGEGQLRKIPIPVHYLYVFLAGALIGMFTITGMAGSYARMLWKVERFNQLRAEKDQIKKNYSQLEQATHEKDVQVASLGSIAGEVSAIYGLKNDSRLLPTNEDVRPEQVKASLDTLYALRGSALTGAAHAGLQQDSTSRVASLSDWVRAADAPSLWPVQGRLTSSFGERVDPFNGEGAFHSGIDISVPYGTPVHAAADGVVTFAEFMSGYGRLINIDHGHGVATRYGHLSGFAVAAGQHVRRGQVIGYVGTTGRVTSPHLHYEVRIQSVPVNPHKYLRTTLAELGGKSRS
ncbi:MAG: M23 family metallopeptidase [Acidobacteriota bacterium]|nr:M23 family metallopeptidase [Acidobacteriota bacterium]